MRRGYEIAIFSYDALDVPAGVELRDAGEIVPAQMLAKFLYAGQPNLSHFSDYFRYLLFQKTDRIWVDADMLLIRRIDQELPTTILAREVQPSICGAIMRIGSEGGHLDNLISATEALMGKDLLWGETGPLLLTKEFGRKVLLSSAFEADRFYAIDHDDFWKVFLPEFADECESRTYRAWGVHLWNNIVDTLGYWKRIAPPVGSYLHNALAADDLLDPFLRTYPASVMKQMVSNFRLRKTGEDLGIKQLVTQIVPSIGRTLRHYRR